MHGDIKIKLNIVNFETVLNSGCTHLPSYSEQKMHFKYLFLVVLYVEGLCCSFAIMCYVMASFIRIN
jgi:hypothetical protein